MPGPVFFDGDGDSFDADGDGDRADEDGDRADGDGDRGDHDDHGGSDLEQLLWNELSENLKKHSAVVNP